MRKINNCCCGRWVWYGVMRRASMGELMSGRVRLTVMMERNGALSIWTGSEMVKDGCCSNGNKVQCGIVTTDPWARIDVVGFAFMVVVMRSMT